MTTKSILYGKTPLYPQKRRIGGGSVELDGESCYRISNYDEMPPFFMSLVSDSDHWMFISSNGALTAGRKNPDNALFPYYTDDRIHDSKGQTGSCTIAFVSRAERTYYWEPFLQSGPELYRVERNLYKNFIGSRLVFEEINHDLSVAFRTSWTSGESYGFVRHSVLINLGRTPVSIDILDGIQNLLPYGMNRRFQMEFSTLADGYKKNELLPETGLGLFTLSSIPIDKAEPSEALKSTTVWSCGLKKAVRLVSSRQVDRFRRGLPVKQETDVRAARGAYFVNARFKLPAGARKDWHLVADVNQDASDVAALVRLIRSKEDPKKLIEGDLKRSAENLVRIVAGADGLQATRDVLSSARHFSNVLFNVMRGGIFDDGYTVDVKDFISFLEKAAPDLVAKLATFWETLPGKINHSELLSAITALDEPDLEKLADEYLPITFSRRHGDPSRPWNLFSIDIKDAHGGKLLNYQGNWRDIFQNWEALALSFPDYAESMISKFVNASTADGYNPYRVTRDGFEWEKLDPHDPWSYIGYWGDHQIAYLLKLLEWSDRTHPGKLRELLIKDIFAYSNVPYRIRPYDDLLRDPHSTIDFDGELDREIEARVKEIGMEGKLIRGRDGRILRVNLAEKLLIPLLAKLANFIPEAGIWMNTQRPEWNDANNALVGFGVSMVTLCYLRRYLAFCRALFEASPDPAIRISEEVADLLASFTETFRLHLSLLDGPLTDADRRTVLDGLGRAGGGYRTRIYRNGFTERRREESAGRLIGFIDLALRYVDHSIRANRRPDGLYHAYNLMAVEKDGSVSIRRLYEMLEGQVAALSSGLLSAEECLDVLDALRASALYRKDQASYILYPDRRLPRFVEKNNIPAEAFGKSELLIKMAGLGDRRIVIRDADGGLHFNGEFRNASILKNALEKIGEADLREAAVRETPSILDLYERMFDHRSFTGRSGTFYKYEGLGSIYWHMVSKLCLAVQEVFIHAERTGGSGAVLKRLADHYHEIREGIGVHKPPEKYGAFPTDPYSHTPGFAGVQQPGMTGQVKEDILTRFGELGLRIGDGCISFRPGLLRRDEFIQKPSTYHFICLDGKTATLDLPRNSLAFTFCQVPVVYRLADDPRIRLWKKDGTAAEIRGIGLDRETSASIFGRTGDVVRLEVFLKPGC
jgi:hypothetical protein